MSQVVKERSPIGGSIPVPDTWELECQEDRHSGWCAQCKLVGANRILEYKDGSKILLFSI